MNKYKGEGIVIIIFVKSAENYRGTVVKNLSAELHKKHVQKMISEKFKQYLIFDNILS